MNHQNIQLADILIVRSGVQVNEALLAGSKVKFVGTATIGDDHVDKAYLQQHNIGFASAAGSSTESVVEYMLASLYWLEAYGKLDMQQHTLGIIGVGRIGGLLRDACALAGLHTLNNDPPRQRLAHDDDLLALNTLLAHADILTLHTPLINSGEDTTFHLLNRKRLAEFQGFGIINAGRGACLDNQALLDWLNESEERFAILDCWEHEPNILSELVTHPQLLLTTPHIAGHSLDGKAANTLFVYNELCNFLKVKPSWNPQDFLPEIDTHGLDSLATKQHIISQLYPIVEDTFATKTAALSPATFPQWFRGYRSNYPMRRAWRQSLKTIHPDLERMFF